MDISWPGGSWETTLQYAALIFGTYAAALWVTIIYWTFRDIRQRTRDGILQAFSVLLVVCFFVPGLWIYLILRPRYTLTELYERSLEEEALLQELEDQKACPTCRRRVKDDFLVCPSCRTQLKELCRSCSKPLSYAWNACPFCGLEKTPRAAFAQRPRPVERVERPVERPLPQAAQQRAAVAAVPSGGSPPPPQAATDNRPARPSTPPAPRPAPPDPFARRPSQPNKNNGEDAGVIDLTAD
jgi:RNA polymerase subunit RPABC4/transcription elongation factor Spt4